MANADLAVEILKEIRDEARGTNARLDTTIKRLDATVERLDTTIERLDVNVARLDTIELTLLDLAEQQRFVVRHTKALAERDSRLELRVGDLEHRVEKLETTK